MTSEPNLTGFSDYLPNIVASDWNPDFFAVEFSDLNPHAFDSVAPSQSFFGPAQPPPLSNYENGHDPLWEIPQGAPPTQLLGQYGLLFPPPVPGVSSVHHGAAIQPANDPIGNCGPHHGGVREEGLALVGDTYLPVAVPTMPLWIPSFPTDWVKIPQRIYNHGCKQIDFKQLEPTFFSTKDHPGINLGDALHKNISHLGGKDDPVLQDASATISCRLLFPGYPDNGSSCQIHTLNWTKNRVSITRAKLAHGVAKKVDKYLACMKRIVPDASVEDHWKIEQGFMRIDNMYLASLVSVSKGSFQPEIWVATSSVPRVGAEHGIY